MRLINEFSKPMLEVCTPAGLKLVPVYDIMCIMADHKGSIIVDKNNERIKTNILLITFETLLSGYSFFRSHKKYIINLSYIETYSHDYVTLKDNLKISLSRNKAADFREKFILFNSEKV